MPNETKMSLAQELRALAYTYRDERLTKAANALDAIARDIPARYCDAPPTPGPWKLREGHPRTILGPDGRLIATAKDSTVGRNEAIANAALIVHLMNARAALRAGEGAALVAGIENH